MNKPINVLDTLHSRAVQFFARFFNKEKIKRKTRIEREEAFRAVSGRCSRGNVLIQNGLYVDKRLLEDEKHLDQ